ncbi:expressed unknown protein [Seminavis robusta]|uniref:Uncharacterized protein n=1 Tax=Seminavis robusta TaxID=568900 RepID=A0A9N8E7N1_9STRA|nr:expressed unknown protein [Seminavis robusta]|eukprot:Sro635_g179150.1 n/a (987) ;mRNA; r:36644-39604
MMSCIQLVPDISLPDHHSPYDDEVKNSLDNRVRERLQENAKRQLVGLAENDDNNNKHEEEGELQLDDIMCSSQPDLLAASDMSVSSMDMSMNDSSRVSLSSSGRSLLSRRARKKKKKYLKLLGGSSSKKTLLGASQHDIEGDREPLRDDSFQTARTSDTSSADRGPEPSMKSQVEIEKEHNKPEIPEKDEPAAKQTHVQLPQEEPAPKAQKRVNASKSGSHKETEGARSKQLLDVLANIGQPAFETAEKTTTEKSGCEKDHPTPPAEQTPVQPQKEDPAPKARNHVNASKNENHKETEGARSKQLLDVLANIGQPVIETEEKTTTHKSGRAKVRRAVSNLGEKLGGADLLDSSSSQALSPMSRSSSASPSRSERRQKIRKTFTTLGGSAGSSMSPARIPRRRNVPKLPNAAVASRLHGTRMAAVAAAAGVQLNKPDPAASGDDDEPAPRASTGSMRRTNKPKPMPRRTRSLDAEDEEPRASTGSSSAGGSKPRTLPRRSKSGSSGHAVTKSNDLHKKEANKSMASTPLAAFFSDLANSTDFSALRDKLTPQTLPPRSKSQTSDDGEPAPRASTGSAGNSSKVTPQALPRRVKSLGASSLAADAALATDKQSGGRVRPSFPTNSSRRGSLGSKKVGKLAPQTLPPHSKLQTGDNEEPAPGASTGSTGSSSKFTPQALPRRVKSLGASCLADDAALASGRARPSLPTNARNSSLGSKKVDKLTPQTLPPHSKSQTSSAEEPAPRASTGSMGGSSKFTPQALPRRVKSLGVSGLAADAALATSSRQRPSFPTNPQRSSSLGSKKVFAQHRPSIPGFRTPRPPPRNSLPPAPEQKETSGVSRRPRAAPRNALPPAREQQQKRAPEDSRRPRAPPRSSLPPAPEQQPEASQRPRAPPRNNLPPASHSHRSDGAGKRSASVDDSERYLSSKPPGSNRTRHHNHHAGSQLPPKSKSESATSAKREAAASFDWKKFAEGSCGSGKGVNHSYQIS